MHVLVIHNSYQQAGGEDAVFRDEVQLLRDRGHRVTTLTESNHRINELGRVRTAARTMWSRESYRKLRELIRTAGPDVAHVHNSFPLLSPSIYYAASACGVPVVQTLHNYRLGCLNACFYRDGKICEDCLPRRWAWPGVARGCYQGSRAGSAVVAAMLGIHRAAGTWHRKVDAYIALSEFAAAKFVSLGLPADRLAVVPNFLPTVPAPSRRPRARKILFVGRLSPEKGVEALLEAWLNDPPAAQLVIAGDGPLLDSVTERSRHHPGIEVRGACNREQVVELMQTSAALVFPSQWYEGMPMVLLEAMAAGCPILASRLGGIGELVRDLETGRLFDPGSPRDLCRAMHWALEHPEAMQRLAGAARAEFDERFTAQAHYRNLTGVYRNVVRRPESP